MENTLNPFGVYFNLMKIRYPVYDESLSGLEFLNPSDKVNLFINLETILKYLSMSKDLEKKLIEYQSFSNLMKADIINIAAHYKDFFKGNGLDCNIILYMTDLSSDTDNFKEVEYAEDFRSYYIMKYTSNPRFILLGERFLSEIIPETKHICEFIPNVYLITGKNIDGGLIPYIIGKSDQNRKNLIISSDLHETQYHFESGFVDHLYIRTYTRQTLECQVEGYLKEISKNKTIDPGIVKLFSNGSFYRILLACIGDKYRSVENISGIRMKSMVRILTEAITSGKITPEVRSAELLADLFPSEIQKQMYHNLLVLDIQNEYEMLGEGDIKQITSQIVDRSDLNSLCKLNQTIFSNNPIHLESLL